MRKYACSSCGRIGAVSSTSKCRHCFEKEKVILHKKTQEMNPTFTEVTLRNKLCPKCRQEVDQLIVLGELNITCCLDCAQQFKGVNLKYAEPVEDQPTTMMIAKVNLPRKGELPMKMSGRRFDGVRLFKDKKPVEEVEVSLKEEVVKELEDKKKQKELEEAVLNETKNDGLESITIEELASKDFDENKPQKMKSISVKEDKGKKPKTGGRGRPKKDNS